MKNAWFDIGSIGAAQQGPLQGHGSLTRVNFNTPTPERVVVHNSTPYKNVSAISTQRFQLPTAFRFGRHQQYMIEYI